MNSKQSGFTLIEIAIVLVIIGLLLGGVLKGQELINSAKVKNMATDFRNIPLFIYGYQDKYRALPGDHHTVVAAVSGATLATTPITSGGLIPIACTNPSAGATCTGNGVIDGVWNTVTATDETALFWQHARMAGLAAGPTATGDANYYPTNADGGRMGIESGAAATGGPYIQNGAITVLTGVVTANGTFMTPTYLMCSSGILGKYAKQLDSTIDDGEPGTGSLRVLNSNHVRGAVGMGLAAVNDSASYIVCMGL
jgi:prepilin-type N-terminal cleavage/methylation domain-containing protein